MIDQAVLITTVPGKQGGRSTSNIVVIRLYLLSFQVNKRVLTNADETYIPKNS
jgi:hypothetical protein